MSAAASRLQTAIEAAIRAHCEAQYPHEACGLLLGAEAGQLGLDAVVEAVPAPNEHADDHSRRYEIPPGFQLKIEREAEERGLEVMGYYHSHPDHPAVPSEYDREHAWAGYIYVICAVETGTSGDLMSYSLDDEARFVAL
jgi:proteasome lid subunit RPN8/RPN11